MVRFPSTGWRFYWYKAVPQVYGSSYVYEHLPGSTNGTKQNVFIIHGQTSTAGYMCIAGRANPVYFTEYSEVKFVWSGDVQSAVSLTVAINSVQHFLYDEVILICQGNSDHWRVRTSPESILHQCSAMTMRGAICTTRQLRRGSAVHWCESASGEFSNAVNITVSDEYCDIILVSPAQPVSQGDSVTLRCTSNTGNTPSSAAAFYHNDKLIQSDSRELKIPAVSKSDEGFYKCRHKGSVSAQSWMSVKENVKESSSFPELSIILLICGTLLIILLLLLLLLRYRCDLKPTIDGLRLKRATVEMHFAGGGTPALPPTSQQPTMKKTNSISIRRSSTERFVSTTHSDALRTPEKGNTIIRGGRCDYMNMYPLPTIGS
ncbi:Fc receptor 5 [Solea senegalensis]|uniref:Fc receptor 5 n=1 Tax=Solea senegalensis TaxID=28829 RepID=A0AAV6QZF1_SOLSE|nr:Fc receptor 5 [Solea senegalensis]